MSSSNYAKGTGTGKLHAMVYLDYRLYVGGCVPVVGYDATNLVGTFCRPYITALKYDDLAIDAEMHYVIHETQFTLGASQDTSHHRIDHMIADRHNIKIYAHGSYYINNEN